MKIHDWKEVIEYFSRAGYEEELWDYATALRSCDGKEFESAWKMLITCLIRGKCESAFDITNTFWEMRFHYNEDISKKLNNCDMPSHWVGHSIAGLNSLSIYYRNALNNKVISSLLSKLKFDLLGINKNIEDIPITVEKIINLLYEDNSKNGK